MSQPTSDAGKTEPSSGTHYAGLAAGGIAGAATILMLGNVLSRVLGLAREQVASGLFGTGDKIAAFTIADNIHTMLFDLVISGMMQAALVPVLSEYAAEERRDELRRITGALLTFAFIVVGGVVVLLEIFAPAAVDVMTSLGGDQTARGPETVELTVDLVRLILPAVLLLALSTILMATLYALQRFSRPALSLSIRNVAIVFAALTLGRDGLGVKSMAIGVVAGALLLIVFLLPGLRDCMPRLNVGFNHPAIRRIGVLYLPIFLGLFVNTVALVVDRNLAWEAGEDAIGAMRYATTLNQMVLGLVAAAISLAALPTLSRYYSTGNEAAYWTTLSRGLRMVAVLVIPATFGLAVLSWPVVQLLFQHGATSRDDAWQILIAVLIYLPGTLAAAFDQVLIFAFYARQDTRRPQIVGVLAVGVYFLVALPLAGRFGMPALVAANSVQFIFHTIVMVWLLRRLRNTAPAGVLQREGLRLAGTLRTSVLVAGVMAVFAGGIALALSMTIPESSSSLGRVARELTIVGVPTGLGVVLYAVGLARLRVEEMQVLLRRAGAVVLRA